jgi:hypothetical protein
MPMATDIFKMLREGRVAEALPSSRDLYRTEPDNIWNLRALVRSLCKMIWEVQDASQVESLARELAALPALPDDDSDRDLTAYRERTVRRADPLQRQLLEIRQISNAGRNRDALRELRLLWRENSGHKDVANALAWEIWRDLIQALRQEKPEKPKVRSLLLEYRNLNPNQPSEIHSRVLEAAARAAGAGLLPSFCGFLKWWGTERLRPEDFTGNPARDGTRFPSVVELAIKGLGKTVQDEPSLELVRFAESFMADHADRFPDRAWFPYYRALTLVRCGELEQARAMMTPIVREKPSEYWAWHHLALCYAPGDRLRLACLCKARLSRVAKPQMLLRVQADLAMELMAQEYFPEARRELETSAGIRREHGWSIPEALDKALSEPRIAKVEVAANTARLREKAAEAEEALWDDAPWLDAVLGAKQVRMGERNDLFAIMDVRREDGKMTSVPVKMRELGLLSDCPVGTPASVKLGAVHAQRQRVVALRQREARPWDCLPRIAALVLRVNEAKGAVALLDEHGTESVCYWNETPESRTLSPGDVVQCAAVQSPTRVRVRFVERAKTSLTGSFWRPYQGVFRPREKGGGHSGDVFLAERLCTQLVSDDTAAGMARKRTDERTGRAWWEAVTVLSKA